MTPKALAATLRAVADYVERWDLSPSSVKVDDYCADIYVRSGMTRRAAEQLTGVRAVTSCRYGKLPTPAGIDVSVIWSAPPAPPAPAPDVLAELPDPHGETDALFERDPIAGTSQIASDSDARSGDAATVEAGERADRLRGAPRPMGA